MRSIRKAVFPAAGLGTRFLPATKAQPKEMLPLVDKPIIQYVIEEAVAAGITSIIIVTGKGKNAIEDHFDVSKELERLLVEVPLFRMLSASDVRTLALDARPLFLGPTQRFVVEGREGTSLFLVGEGEVELLRKPSAAYAITPAQARETAEHLESAFDRLKPFIGAISAGGANYSNETHAKYRALLQRKHRVRRPR